MKKTSRNLFQHIVCTCLHALQHFRLRPKKRGLICTMSLPGPGPRSVSLSLLQMSSWALQNIANTAVPKIQKFHHPRFLNRIFFPGITSKKSLCFLLLIATCRKKQLQTQIRTNGHKSPAKTVTQHNKPQRLNGLVSSHDGSFSWNASWPQADCNFSSGNSSSMETSVALQHVRLRQTSQKCHDVGIIIIIINSGNGKNGEKSQLSGFLLFVKCSRIKQGCTLTVELHFSLHMGVASGMESWYQFGLNQVLDDRGKMLFNTFFLCLLCQFWLTSICGYGDNST